MLGKRRSPVGAHPEWVMPDQNGVLTPVGFGPGLAALARFAADPVAGDPVSLPDEGVWEAPFGGTKIICVGRNYRPHAEELGNPLPKEPLWFTKPPSSLIGHGGTIRLPQGFGRIDYEGELALVLGRRARNLGPGEGVACIAGVTLAVDVTARELQKTDGQWTRAKGFDTFCPLGPWIAPYSAIWQDVPLQTFLNGVEVQSDRTSSLVFPFDHLLRHLSACMTLEPGDVILTGTPAGVGPLKAGDHLRVAAAGPVPLVLECRVAG